jgi:hypothetical protein
MLHMSGEVALNEGIHRSCSRGEEAMPNRRDRDAEWGNDAIVGFIASMVVVMALIAFTLHRNSPLVAAAPTVTTPELSTSGQGGIAPVRGRSGMER